MPARPIEAVFVGLNAAGAKDCIYVITLYVDRIEDSESG